MAKAEFTTPQPRIPDVRLMLTGEEAEALRAVLGPLSGAGGGSTYQIYCALNDLLKPYAPRTMSYKSLARPEWD
jgi:hypothetical protein